MDYQQNFIELMVRSNVLRFGDFTTKSGRKTPFFINTGNYQTGEQIYKLGEYYAAAIQKHLGNNFDTLFGPAYKGIPLSVAASMALYQNHQINTNYTFNRKEAKDHGEGGTLIGYQPKDGDRVVIVEDVVTAGTAVRETMKILESAAKVKVVGLIVSVNRMEKGTGSKTALQELEDEFGIKTYSIVTIQDIVERLHNKPVDGKILIDDTMKSKIEEYRKQYGA